MANQDEPKSWWQTFPAMLGAIAALITALTGAWIAINRSPDTGPKSPLKREVPAPRGAPAPVTGTTAPAPQASRLSMRGIVEPRQVKAGEKATIYVTVTDQNQNTVQDVKVVVAAGGGKFLNAENASYDPHARLHGPYSVGGLSSIDGRFTTWWVCNPCAPSYGISIKATKDGYSDATTDVTIAVR